jgi:hypothetical protein
MSTTIHIEGLNMSHVHALDVSPIRSGSGKHGVSVSMRWRGMTLTRDGAGEMAGLGAVLTIGDAAQLVRELAQAIETAHANEAKDRAVEAAARVED